MLHGGGGGVGGCEANCTRGRGIGKDNVALGGGGGA